MKNKKYLLGSFAALALVVANLGAGINCWGFYHQPKFPEKLRKF
ncbi:cyclic lactone autoinducer peptide [Serpentinicella alkaliphila]|uniref:Cyclic lactone autoinducer peptide n=1 Tax=Serpentinicella alkaliphila TaxID=1734049 RepID=A0A4R2TMA7_9FIRM|nr:cyclic lactone autoinducer peptide [Serpentinicella alkaliphila]QUH24717.1 cyclic lactone autoinducer peptide [Serpentinicella alkaliphila]TCQ03707.1 cyclic lactone autoinducer peptide [Serpentinicella alkaliphila]